MLRHTTALNLEIFIPVFPRSVGAGRRLNSGGFYGASYLHSTRQAVNCAIRSTSHEYPKVFHSESLFHAVWKTLQARCRKRRSSSPCIRRLGADWFVYDNLKKLDDLAKRRTQLRRRFCCQAFQRWFFLTTMDGNLISKEQEIPVAVRPLLETNTIELARIPTTIPTAARSCRRRPLITSPNSKSASHVPDLTTSNDHVLC
jgi:hypothetical protein